MVGKEKAVAEPSNTAPEPMMTIPEPRITSVEVAKEIIAHFGIVSAEWARLWFEGGFKSAGLSSSEFTEFKEACAVMGIPDSQQLSTLGKILRMIDRHGDDGHGDKEETMSRIIYWIQHVAAEQVEVPTLGCSGP